MYVNFMRRVPRPRGLGGIARVAAGLGTWIVDRPWGLSPAIIPGQPRPYQDMVRTMLPRSQHPRLLNVSYRVLAAGSWPRLLPANSPVFRTPVMAPGAQAVNEALPGDPISRGVAGYGWVPMGVAHPPFFLAETAAGMSGYGSNGSGTKANLSDADRQWVADNPRRVTKAIRDSALTYAKLRAQQNLYHTLFDTFAKQAATYRANVVSTKGSPEQRATQAVYGSAEAKFDAANRLQRWAGAAAEIKMTAEAGGIPLTGPVGVLATQPGPNKLRQGVEPESFGTHGYGVEPVTLTVLGVIAIIALTAVIVGGATWSIARYFDEAATISAQTNADWMASTRAVRTAQSEVLADLSRQLSNATDPADIERLRTAIATITASMTAIAGVNTDLINAAGPTNWAQVMLLGGVGFFAWWMLGKPFYKGVRRSAQTTVATYHQPTPIGG